MVSSEAKFQTRILISISLFYKVVLTLRNKQTNKQANKQTYQGMASIIIILCKYFRVGWRHW